ncbi:RidA family protein [Galbitalea sp. SE-J8]|uniref:RidA family protein n=1 Tax=Galbitalea sp. SE-J8 TaxID=3054952 RepID=UPI00259CB0FC|nr:RidA family protein [Galbitalea sp. SE-J8]MDM4763617.1 RidA family protein [Galbitalea sp. SE-J8]
MTALPTPIDPPELFTSPAFPQGMIAPAGRTLYVGGQNGVDETGALVEGGLGAQTERALRNVLAVLAAADAAPEHVVKLTIYLDPGVDPTEAYAASRAVWTARTCVTVLGVAPSNPGALVEIEAIAALPD